MMTGFWTPVGAGGGSAGPDVSMFSSPAYQFWAGDAEESGGTTGFGFPEVLAGLGDASAVNDPALVKGQSDGTNSFDAGDYDGGNDGHDWTPDTQLPTGDSTFAIAALAWLQSGTGFHSVGNWGDSSGSGTAVNLRFDNGQASVTCYGVTAAETGSGLEGSWVTIGGRYDGTTLYPYANGTAGTGASVTYNLQDANHSLGYLGYDSSTYGDVYIAEVVVCDGAESDQAFSDYHSNRLA